jgi:hypothetical protein
MIDEMIDADRGGEILKNILRKHAPEFLEDLELSERLVNEVEAEHARLMERAKELYADCEAGRLTSGEAEAKWSSEWEPFSNYCGNLLEEVVQPVQEGLDQLRPGKNEDSN